MSVIQLKIHFNSSNILIEAPTLLKELTSSWLIPNNISAFTYLDHEGDTIEITNEDDYQMALAYAIDHNVKTIILDSKCKVSQNQKVQQKEEIQAIESQPNLESEVPVSKKLVNMANEVFEKVKVQTQGYLAVQNQIFLPKAKVMLKGLKETCKVNYDDALKAFNNVQIDKKVTEMVEKVSNLKRESKKKEQIKRAKTTDEKTNEKKVRISKKEKIEEKIGSLQEKLNDVTEECVKKVQGFFETQEKLPEIQIKRIKAKAKNNIQRLVHQEFKELFRRICSDSTKACFEAIEEAAALKSLEINNQKPQEIVKYEIKQKVTCGNCIHELNSEIYYQSSKNEELTVCENCEEELSPVESFSPFIKIRPSLKTESIQLSIEEAKIIEPQDPQKEQLNQIVKSEAHVIDNTQDKKVDVDKLSKDEFACFLVLLNNVKGEYCLDSIKNEDLLQALIKHKGNVEEAINSLFA